MIKSAEEFCKLRNSKIEEEYTRAATEEAPLEVWYEVIKKFPEMKTWVIHNKTVPEEILRLLANDNDSSVRSRVADKRKCPEDVLLKLATDNEESVRLRVAYNPKVTPEILEILTSDNWDEVARVATDRLKKMK